MMSSGKARPVNAELDPRVKRRPQSLQRKRWPPSWVVRSCVTITELQCGHDMDISFCPQPARPTPPQENKRLRPKINAEAVVVNAPESSRSVSQAATPCRDSLNDFAASGSVADSSGAWFDDSRVP